MLAALANEGHLQEKQKRPGACRRGEGGRCLVSLVTEGSRRKRKCARTYVREDCQALEVALSLGWRVVHKVRMGRQPRGNSDKCSDEGTPINRDRGTRPRRKTRAKATSVAPHALLGHTQRFPHLLIRTTSRTSTGASRVRMNQSSEPRATGLTAVSSGCTALGKMTAAGTPATISATSRRGNVCM